MASAQMSGQLVLEKKQAHEEHEGFGGLPHKGRKKQKPRDETKKQILQFLEECPGASITEVSKVVGSSHQNASRHLSQLNQERRVELDRDGRKTYYFLANQREIHVRLRPYLRNPAKREAVGLLLENPDRTWSVNELATASGLCFLTMQRFLEKLKERDLVVFEKRDSRYIVKGTVRLASAVENHDRCLGSLERPPQGEGESSLQESYPLA